MPSINSADTSDQTTEQALRQIISWRASLDVDDLPLLVGFERSIRSHAEITGANQRRLGVHAEQTNSVHRIFILSKHTQ